MWKKNYKNHHGFTPHHSHGAGFTLMEVLIAIAIISIMSSFFIISISNNDLEDEIVLENEKLIADIRYARNLAMSRTTHDFGTGEQYPAGGYGIYFEDLATANAKYIVFADSGIDGGDNYGFAEGYDYDTDFIVKEIILSNAAIELNDYVSDKEKFYFTFVTENQVNTDMSISDSGKYQVEIINKGPGSPTTGYRSVIAIGERAENSTGELEYIWGNIGYDYSVYTPPKPPPPPQNPPRIRDL